jgi:hypothetical protein
MHCDFKRALKFANVELIPSREVESWINIQSQKLEGV